MNMKFKFVTEFSTLNRNCIKCMTSLLVLDENGNMFMVVTGIGVAKCDEQDEFNEELGRRIAESKAVAVAVNKLNKNIINLGIQMSNEIIKLGEISDKCEKILDNELHHYKELAGIDLGLHL